jgi:predicted nucleic acid-binding protein
MFLDTTIVVEVLRSGRESRRFRRILEAIKDDPLFISMLQLAEFSDWCLENSIDPSDRISRLKGIVGVVPLTEDICLEGSRIKHGMREHGVSKFSLLDGIILASARSIDQKLLTTDSDFRKAEDAVVIG